MTDHLRYDALTVLFVDAFDETVAIRLPADPAYHYLTTIDTPFCEPCERCGDPTSTTHGHGHAIIAGGDGAPVEGLCPGCWGTGRALFAWTDGPGPALATWVPPVIAAPWLAARASMPCSPAPRMPFTYGPAA